LKSTESYHVTPPKKALASDECFPDMVSKKYDAMTSFDMYSNKIVCHLLTLRVNAYPNGGPGGASSYILVYTDVPLEWGTFLTSKIYQWGAIFINPLYQWIDDLACHYINGW
jgi:hypothetical protein